MILAKINVMKIDKTKLFPGKEGAKYLDLVLIETPNGSYDNDYMVVQGVTKEERGRGVKGAILGNAKIMGAPAAKQASQPEPETNADDVPF